MIQVLFCTSQRGCNYIYIVFISNFLQFWLRGGGRCCKFLFLPIFKKVHINLRGGTFWDFFSFLAASLRLSWRKRYKSKIPAQQSWGYSLTPHYLQNPNWPPGGSKMAIIVQKGIYPPIIGCSKQLLENEFFYLILVAVL